MNLPNLLTFARFLLIPIYFLCFLHDYRLIAFLIVLLQGATDILDGYLARKHNQVTEMGIMLDPLADKLMMLAVMVSLLYSKDISWYAGSAIFIRELGMIAGAAYFHFQGRKAIPANWMGKLTTILYYIVITLIYFRVENATILLWLVIIFSFYTTFMYFLKSQHIADRRMNRVKGAKNE